MNSRKLLIVFVFLINQLSGQELSIDTIFELKNVDISSSRIEQFSVGYKIKSVSSDELNTHTNTSISELLSSSGGANISSYGAGGLSTISIRGGSPAHTAVLWNGINIQNSMNGMTNLSSLPVELFNDVSVQYGGSGALVGSGGAFGALHLSTKATGVANSFIGYSVGSFNNNKFVVGSDFSIKKSDFSIKVYQQSSDNNFWFYNTYKFGSPYQRQENNGFNQYGLVVNNVININEKLLISTSGVYQHYNKNIQTLMGDYNLGNENQIDNTLLFSSILKYSKEKFSSDFKLAYTQAGIIYSNPDLYSKPSVSVSESFISELNTDYNLSLNQFINININYTHEKTDVDSYSNLPERGRFTLLFGYKVTKLFDVVNIVINNRNEFVNNKLSTPQISVGSDGDIFNWLGYNFNIANVYRVPTFNDLYWAKTQYSSGNLNLKNEYGYSGDIGLNQKLKTEHVYIEASQNIFYNSINNMIKWMPDDNSVWTPVNLTNATSVGIELGAKISYKHNNSVFTIKENYSFTNANKFDNGVVTMQSYVPKHNLNTKATYRYKKFNVGFTSNYLSKQKTIKGYLKAYSVSDLSTGYEFGIKKFKIDVTAKINNVFNQQYQVRYGYATALINYSLSTRINF
ncbi:MAG: TonB-dependent receptor plug domain-containing protein [Ichthyobacteriaceae bacterium]|nr:TonB-dependent receptor plug domain-containing protein [Ichthyobacteriaceae bacterium]